MKYKCMTNRILKRLREIIHTYAITEGTYRLSEIDTQVLLVEPVLFKLGWGMGDPGKVRRAGRQTSGANVQVFDIELYGDKPTPLIVIECKRLHDETFNADKIGAAGKLVWKENYYQQFRGKDGLAQLRRYCVDYRRKFDPNITIPVFTDGETWVAFRGTAFVSNPESVVPRSACLFEPLSVHAPNFLEVVGAYLARDKFGNGL